jgi:hypothetical protein
VSSRRGLRRQRRQSIWLRIVAAFVLAMVTSWSTLAWAIPCCGHGDRCDDEQAAGQGSEAGDGDEAASDHHEEAPAEEPCSCPPGSGPCCGAVPLPALVPLVAPVLSHAPPWVDLALPDITQRPPDGTREDVLHVPKSRLASKA